MFTNFGENSPHVRRAHGAGRSCTHRGPGV